MAASIIPTMLRQNEEIIDIIESKKKDNMKGIITYSNSMKNVYLADEGEYKGIKYFIIAGRIHPCAYMMCAEELVDNHRHERGELD